MRIGELAARVGLEAATIRYYEARGLLPPPIRLANNYRSYGADHERRLLIIKHCRRLDLSLEETATILSLEGRSEKSAAEAHELIGRHVRETTRRIEELRRLRAHLLSLALCCHGHGEGQECGIMTTLREVSPDGVCRCCQEGGEIADGSPRDDPRPVPGKRVRRV